VLVLRYVSYELCISGIQGFRFFRVERYVYVPSALFKLSCLGGPDTQSNDRKVGWVQILFVLSSLLLIVQWWNLTKLGVTTSCFTFNFLHFSLCRCEFLLLLFILMCCVSHWWMQRLQFFIFLLVNGSKVFFCCALSYLLCIMLL